MKNINLFINWFQHQDPNRQQEFDYCLKKNLLVFDRIIQVKEYATYTEFFKLMAKFPDDANVLANLDIYFDSTIEMAKWIKPHVAYCLTRHEDAGKGQLKPFNKAHPGARWECSQDAWVLTGDKFLSIDAKFQLGKPGCDNRIAAEFQNAGLKILNPSLDIHAIHLHRVDTRASTERRAEQVPPPYLFIEPSNIQDV